MIIRGQGHQALPFFLLQCSVLISDPDSTSCSIQKQNSGMTNTPPSGG